MCLRGFCVSYSAKRKSLELKKICRFAERQRRKPPGCASLHSIALHAVDADRNRLTFDLESEIILTFQDIFPIYIYILHLYSLLLEIA